MQYLYLLAGFIILLLSGEFLVKGGVALARKFRISTRVVGVTIVSFGTSAPELVVSVNAALTGHPAISIGNVIGSNISNIALVLGLVAIFLPVPVRRKSVRIDWPIMMVATILFYLFILNGNLQFFEGLTFIVLLMGFVSWSIYNSRRENYIVGKRAEKPRYPFPVAIIMIVLSSAGLMLGADWLVKGASGVARAFGVSEHAISVSVIALGTSIPELATSIVAAIRKQMDISIGNIIGSNLFNLWGILGITSMVRTIPVESSVIQFDVFWLLGISLLLFVFILPFKGSRITRFEGVVFIVIYAVYIYLVFRK
ncbi:MAG: calcium/sodium antiporter [Bacteroidales bacterium]|nr:MAG: calcium/sodium antiporter [Bacteroidales bacterium]